MTQHSAYVWHPLHCRWQRTDSISPNHCIYDVTSTSAMTTQPCIRYHTHCIYVITPSPLTFHPLMYDITPTFWVTSYEVYITSQPIIISSHYSTYDITASLDDIITLFVCHGNHYVYDILVTICDVTHTVCMTTLALYLTWHPFYLPSHLLYKSSHPLCQRHHTNYVRHYRWHMYANMCTIHDIISTL